MPTDINHRRRRYHNFQFFTLHFQLKNRPCNSKDDITTWYHLFSQRYAASKRFNGRTRGSLPIDIPTPRPCSAAFLVPPHTLRGSLNASVSVLSCSQFFTYNPCIIAINGQFCQHPIPICIIFVLSRHCETSSQTGRGNPYLQAHRERNGLPRRYAPRNDGGVSHMFLFCNPQGNDYRADAPCQLGDDHGGKQFRGKARGETHMVTEYKGR